MPSLPAAATTELGQAGIAGPAGYHDSGERTRELIWPASLHVYEQMRRSDSGNRSVLRAVTLPILGTRWRAVGTPADRPELPAAATTPGPAGPLAYTRPAGTAVRPAVAEFVEAELGLARDHAGAYRTRDGGVNFEQFLTEALAMLTFGHYPFEQVYAAGAPDTPGLVISDGLPVVAHLRKLAPRPPLSLASVDVAPDGGLAGVHQFVTDPRTGITRTVGIGVDRLVMFTNEREAANWYGTSVFRSTYKNWMIRDVLIRLSAIAVDRTGMGLPVATYDESVQGARAEALKLVTQVRGGEDSGAALPRHIALQLLGVTGSVIDPLPLIKYHEQCMSKGLLAMFLDLGHDAGARSLGDTFLDYFLLGVGAIVRNLETTITAHVVRDLVRLNFGENEPWPVIRADPLSSESTPTAAALAQLAGAGLLGPVGEELVNDVRRRYDMPPLPPGTMQPGTPYGGATVEAATGGGPGPVTGGAYPGDHTSPLPGTATTAPQGVLVPGAPTPAHPAGAALSAAGGWDADLAARVRRLSQAVGALSAAGR